MNTFLAVIRRNYKSFIYYHPILLFLNRLSGRIFQILQILVIYYFLFKGKTNSYFPIFTNNSDYLTFSATGVIMYGYSICILMNVGRALINELRQGTISSLFISDYSRTGYLLGVYVEQFLRSFLELMILILFCYVIGIRFNSISMSSWIISIICVNLCCFAMSIVLAGWMLYTRETFITQNIMFLVIGTLSGISFPILYFPKCIQYISKCIPLTHVLIIFRSLSFERAPISTVFLQIINASIISFIYIFIGYKILRYVEPKIIDRIFE